MSFLDELLAEINGQRAQLADPTGTGGAQAPAAAKPTRQEKELQALAKLPPATQAALRKLKGALDMGHEGDQPNSAHHQAVKFGGQILGYGNNLKRSLVGQSSDFAAIRRGKKLYHVYNDGRIVNVREGAVAEALGIPQQRFGADGPAPTMADAMNGRGTGGFPGGAPAASEHNTSIGADLLASVLGNGNGVGGEQAPVHPSSHHHMGRDGHHVDPATGRTEWSPEGGRGHTGFGGAMAPVPPAAGGPQIDRGGPQMNGVEGLAQIREALDRRRRREQAGHAESPGAGLLRALGL